MASCPARNSMVEQAVSRCPFLHAVKEFQGEEYAARLATNPFAAARDPRTQPILVDTSASVEAVFRLFHGRDGPVPLHSTASSAPAATPPKISQVQPSGSVSSPHTPSPALTTPVGLPLASISISGLGFLPNFGNFFRHSQHRPKQRKQRDGPSKQPKSGGAGKPPPQPSAATTSAASGALSSQHPLQRTFGPLGGLLPLAAASGKLSCPPAIVAMRAAVASLKPVRQLRPQTMPIRSLGIVGTALAANVPCGAWREHTDKFSAQWFVAVHATIPFVAMLRKAVLMPRWAILLTVAGAIAGQAVGARLERARLAQAATPKLPSPPSSSSSSSSAAVVPQRRRCGEKFKATPHLSLTPVGLAS